MEVMSYSPESLTYPVHFCEDLSKIQDIEDRISKLEMRAKISFTQNKSQKVRLQKSWKRPRNTKTTTARKSKKNT